MTTQWKWTSDDDLYMFKFFSHYIREDQPVVSLEKSKIVEKQNEKLQYISYYDFRNKNPTELARSFIKINNRLIDENLSKKGDLASRIGFYKIKEEYSIYYFEWLTQTDKTTKIIGLDIATKCLHICFTSHISSGGWENIYEDFKSEITIEQLFEKYKDTYL